jgi:hypothetical protein
VSCFDLRERGAEGSGQAFVTEAWTWGLALAVAVVATRASVALSFGILIASIATLFIVTSRMNR